MSGIILLLVLAVWFYAVIKLSGYCTSKMQFGSKKAITNIILFLFIFLAPVADDIVGGFQFRALCEEGMQPVYDAKKIEGKIVQLKNSPDQVIAKIIPIREQIWDWVDPGTGKTLIKYRYYYATGGWLSRLIGFPQGSPPYTFDGSCGSRESYLIFDQLNITKNVNSYYGE